MSRHLWTLPWDVVACSQAIIGSPPGLRGVGTTSATGIAEVAVEGTREHDEQLKWWIFGFAGKVEVLARLHLREEIKKGALWPQWRFLKLLRRHPGESRDPS
jgi:hypothetical protein